MKLASLVLAILLTSSALANRSSEEINAANKLDADRFYRSLAPIEQIQIDRIENEAKLNPEKLIPVNKGSGGRVYLLVQGLGLEMYSWHYPFHQAIRQDKTAYFLTWDFKKSLKKNLLHFKKSIFDLKEMHPRKQLTILGYSAGGALMALALSDPNLPELRKRTFLHTIASPLEGYSAPKIIRPIGAFLGWTTIEIGIGIRKKLNLHTLPKCFQSITTNCDLDIHACTTLKKHPQGTKDRPLCGQDNFFQTHDKTHTGLLHHILDVEFGLNLI